MGINAQNTFGTQFGKVFGSTQASDRKSEDQPKSKYWINVGLRAPGTVLDEEAPRFISLNSGIALDNIARKDTTVSGKATDRQLVLAEQHAAQNDLYDQIMAVAEKLAPGEEAILPLQIQLRRVDEKTEVRAGQGTASMGVKLDFAAMAEAE